MENKFAIYDLVAYIIPGSIMLLSVAFFYHSYIHPIPINLLESYKLYISVLFFSSSYICGQILGSFTHQIISTITRTKVIRKPDYESKLPFFSFNYQMMELQEVLVEKAQYLLDNNNIKIDLNNYKDSAVPKEIEGVITFFLGKELHENNEYKRLLVSRSFCGNSAFSVFVFSLAMTIDHFVVCIIGLIVTYLLLARHERINKRIMERIANTVLSYIK